MSLSFDGTNDAAEVASTPVTASNFAMVIRAKRGDISVFREFMEIGNGVDVADWYRLQVTGADVFQASASAASSSSAGSGPFTITDTEWHSYGGLFFGDASRYGGIDGVLGAQQTASRTPTGLVQVRFGTSATLTNDYIGLLADAAIFQPCMTAEQFAFYSAGGSPFDIPNCKSYWPMRDKNFPGRDEIGTRHLTLINNTVYSSDNPYIDPRPRFKDKIVRSENFLQRIFEYGESDFPAQLNTKAWW